MDMGVRGRNLHSWDPLPSTDPNYLQMAGRQGCASDRMGTLRLQADSLMSFLPLADPDQKTTVTQFQNSGERKSALSPSSGN